MQTFTLTNAQGLEARVATLGAALVSLRAPDRRGELANIVLGIDSIDARATAVPHYGGTVGRYANRIANGRFALDGSSFQLPQNDGPNTLHGGSRGFDKRDWTAAPRADAATLRLAYVSAAGEEGFPGELRAHVTYRLGDDDTLAIRYEATAGAATPVNLCNHAYFNLSGDPRRAILDHVLTIHAQRFTPVDAHMIPSGELRPVAGTPFDFRAPRVIGERIDAADPQLEVGQGYDHNWVLDKSAAGRLETAALLVDPGSGRSMEVRTSQPGLQLYTGNHLGGGVSGAGKAFGRRTGLCLETQHFPDSPNRPHFPSTILRPGYTYAETTLLVLRAVN